MNEEIEAVLNEHVRPLLHADGGDMEVLRVEDGVVYFTMTGHCAGCSAADMTAEMLINEELTKRLPGIKKAVLDQQVSEDLLDQARALLRRRHGGE